MCCWLLIVFLVFTVGTWASELTRLFNEYTAATSRFLQIFGNKLYLFGNSNCDIDIIATMEKR